MPRVTQSAFGAGEISPALHGKVDAAQYQTGLALAENFYISVYGGLLNRPGTRLLDEVAEQSRLIPFQTGEDQGFVIEMGDHKARFYTLGGRLVVPTTNAVIGNAVGAAIGQWNDVSTGGASIAVSSQIHEIPGSDGTRIGTLTLNGGLASAFDGTITRAAAFCAYDNAWSGQLGKAWVSSRAIVGIKLHGASDIGFTAYRQQVRITVHGSNDNFQTHVVELATWLVDDRPGIIVEKFFEYAGAFSFGYHRVVIRVPPSSKTPNIAVAELRFYDRDTSSPALSLIGATGSAAWAEQRITTSHTGEEHVIRFFCDDHVALQVGHTTKTQTIASRSEHDAGWHTRMFVPPISPFYLQFLHNGTNTRTVSGAQFLSGGPLELLHPLELQDLKALNYTQDSSTLTLVHPDFWPMELKRGGDGLSWRLTKKIYGPKTDAPADIAITLSKFGTTGTAVHQYVVTYVTSGGEESLPSAPKSIAHNATLTKDNYVRLTVSQPLPGGVIACNLYKLYGGAYGLIGLFVATTDDIGQAPKVDNPPPADRNPFPGPTSFPSCAAFWEQRLGFAGAPGAPETVELSKPAQPHDFGRSSPPRDDDAITFTPAGPRRNIKGMLGGVDLVLFCQSTVLIARRGENALTPALEGGVQQVLARGIGRVRPLAIDQNSLFVGSDDARIWLLNGKYEGIELSLPSEHLFRGRSVIDWAYCEAPWSILWLCMSDGEMLTLSLLPQEGVVGWARASTDGLVESLASVREQGEDVLYLRCRRWLRGAWRNTVERQARRLIADVRDACFVDCGLSYDEPKPIAGMTLNESARIVVSNHGVVTGDLVDLDGTGFAAVDDHRFLVTDVDGSTLWLNADWSGLAEWRGGGLMRQCVRTVSGLSHLEGEVVAVLNTGDVEVGHVVHGGSIALRNPGSRVHVGLPYNCRFETLEIAEEPEGYGRRKSVQNVHVLARDSRALEMGPDYNNLDKPPARSTEAWGAPAFMVTQRFEVTVQPRWGLGGKLVFRQVQPLPSEILSCTPIFERSGG